MPERRLNCPVCKTAVLASGTIDGDLAAHPCPQCQGQWIASKDYWKWLETRTVSSPEPPPAEHPRNVVVKQGETPKFCPDCGRFMRRLKVGHGIQFVVDRCATCGGFWLDANEWENLKSRHIHERLHFIASDAWQAEVARQEREQGHERIVREKIGVEDLEKIKAIKAWIEGHPRKAELYAVLLDKKDPT